MMHSCTHTFAILEVSPATYDEIHAKLMRAGYQDQFQEDNNIDLPPLIKMEGIAVRRGRTPEIQIDKDKLEKWCAGGGMSAAALMTPVSLPPDARGDYYLGIVTDVCKWLDVIFGNHPGYGIACGSAECPNDNVQQAMEQLHDLLFT